MRPNLALAALALVGVIGVFGESAPAGAQTAWSNPTGSIPPLHGPLPTGTIPATVGSPVGVTLPRVGLPLPSLGLPPVLAPAALRAQTPRHRPLQDNRSGRSRGGLSTWPSVVYVVQPAVVYPQAAIQPVSPPISSAQQEETVEPASARLILDVEPRTLQVFVDGYYAGSPADVSSEFSLEPGPHRVELIAPGFETVVFDVRPEPNQSLVYRRGLKAVGGNAAAPAAPVPVAPKTFYLIPGCYLGDVLPKDAGLPATCDISRTVTFQR